MRNIFKGISQSLNKLIVSKKKSTFLMFFVAAALAALLCPPLISATPLRDNDFRDKDFKDKKKSTQLHRHLDVTSETSNPGFSEIQSEIQLDMLTRALTLDIRDIHRNDLIPRDGSREHSEGRGDSATPVPEPSTMLLLGSGLVGLVAFRKRFKILK